VEKQTKLFNYLLNSKNSIKLKDLFELEEPQAKKQSKHCQTYTWNRLNGPKQMVTGNNQGNFMLRAKTTKKQFKFILNKIIYKV